MAVKTNGQPCVYNQQIRILRRRWAVKESFRLLQDILRFDGCCHTAKYCSGITYMDDGNARSSRKVSQQVVHLLDLQPGAVTYPPVSS